MPTTIVKPATASDSSIDAKVAASNQAAADSVTKDTPADPVPDAAATPEPGSTVEPTPMHEVLPAPDADPASAQAAREVDPSEPHDFLEEDFKRDQSGIHPADLDAAGIVASTDPAHTIAKGLNEDGTGANGMVNGDRMAGT